MISLSFGLFTQASDSGPITLMLFLLLPETFIERLIRLVLSVMRDRVSAQNVSPYFDILSIREVRGKLFVGLCLTAHLDSIRFSLKLVPGASRHDPTSVVHFITDSVKPSLLFLFLRDPKLASVIHSIKQTLSQATTVLGSGVLF